MHQVNHLNLEQKNRVEINDESRGGYNVNSQIKFRTTLLKSSLCDYSDAYILVKGSITVSNTGTAAAATDSFNSKAKITGQTDNDGEIHNVETMVPLKYLSNVCGTVEIPLINCEVNHFLTWPANCVIAYTDVENQGATFTITKTKVYFQVVTLSTQNDAKLVPQLKSGFKGTVNWNKYLSKPELLRQSPNLNHLLEPVFKQ